MGHEDPFPPRRLTARSVIRKRTVGATRGDERDAPRADLSATPINFLLDPQQKLSSSLLCYHPLQKERSDCAHVAL